MAGDATEKPCIPALASVLNNQQSIKTIQTALVSALLLAMLTSGTNLASLLTTGCEVSPCFALRPAFLRLVNIPLVNSALEIECKQQDTRLTSLNPDR